MATVDISRMSPRERLDLIGQLWDSLDPQDVPLTPAQTAELERRMATFEADISEAVTLEEIERALDRN
ncbi:addiction module protein [Rhizobium oryzicola]|uniref:Addiction module protein n=1 Tax=Rhizobium oryzicola TaxID=1232668 RepID=A0ABT8SSQ5_9HYPH|nr:addiction module protein [Rhizobium oryzicola]MDO1581427.1 addiction module protein [Rhizobium oryzicola]